jgi:hypothetical protein
MLKSILYVSRSCLDDNSSDAQVADIVSVAESRNTRLQVSGALVFTGDSFAQILEGGETELDDLMHSISRDRRHSDVRIIKVAEIEARLFGDWSMAYTGPSFYVNRHIKPLLAEGAGEINNTRYAERLIELMSEFRKQS